MCFLNHFCSDKDQLPKCDHLFKSMGGKVSSCRLSFESVENKGDCTESLHCSSLGGVVKEASGGVGGVRLGVHRFFAGGGGGRMNNGT